MGSYIIDDMNSFVDSVRALVYNNFGSTNDDTELEQNMYKVKDSEQNEFDQILSHDESYSIVLPYLQKQYNKKTHDTRYVINDNNFMPMLEALNDRMTSNILNNLVNKGLIDTAFDSDANDFVFWLKDENKNSKKQEAD